MGWAEIDKDKVMKLLRKDLGDEALKLLKNKKTLINSSMPREVIAVTEDLLKIHNEITKKGLQPLFLGQAVMDTRDLKTSRLSLQFAYEALSLKLPRAYLKPQGEQGFLYGRDVISDSVLRATGDVKHKGLILVLSQEGDFLGIGFSRQQLLGKRKSKVIKHVVDTGNYLRVERN